MAKQLTDTKKINKEENNKQFIFLMLNHKPTTGGYGGVNLHTNNAYTAAIPLWGFSTLCPILVRTSGKAEYVV